jgi:coproporphyrinogen III oxidase-like Fe-S oxidoreductase
LEIMIRKGKIKPVDEDRSVSHYQILCRMMQDRGYEHYEVSNFCLPGAWSRHNSAYWQGKHYFGVGPSAHSFNGDSRSWNVANLVEYVRSVKEGKVESEKEILSPTTQLNEYIMTSLRTIWGCDLTVVKKKFGNEKAKNLISDASTFIDSKQMIYHNNCLILTPEGRLFADGISSRLFDE